DGRPAGIQPPDRRRAGHIRGAVGRAGALRQEPRLDRGPRARLALVRVEQVLDLAHAADGTRGLPELLDLLLAARLTAQIDDAVLGIHVDRALRHVVAAEDLALDLASQGGVVEVTRIAMTHEAHDAADRRLAQAPGDEQDQGDGGRRAAGDGGHGPLRGARLRFPAVYSRNRAQHWGLPLSGTS